MKRKKVYIRTDANLQIGFGHFIRCLALVEMLNEYFDCFFYTQEPTEYQRKEVERICTLKVLPSDDKKFQCFLNELSGNEIVVLDNYFFSSDYQKSIKNKGCKLVVFGSNDRHYYADVVINYTNLDPLQFWREPYTRLCLGLEWILMRPPFYIKKLVKRDVRTFVICLGGTDQYCFAEKFSSYIFSICPNAIIRIVVTDVVGKDRIKGLQTQGCSVYVNLTAEDMSDIFRMSNIALVSASGVAVEALSQHANVIAGYYVENQKNIYKTLIDGNYIWPIGDFFSKNVLQLLKDSIGRIHAGERKSIFNSENTIEKYRQIFLDLC